MKKLIKSVVCIVVLLSFTGCASIFSGTTDRVSVNSLDNQTVIYVDGAARGKGSISVELERKHTHQLLAKKEGCEDVSTRTGKDFNATSLLNILWGYGMLLAFPVDFVSGAAWNITPSDYTLTPICPGT